MRAVFDCEGRVENRLCPIFEFSTFKGDSFINIELANISMVKFESKRKSLKEKLAQHGADSNSL